VLALQRAAGRINAVLKTPNADYEIVKHWVQIVSGRNYWMWLRDKSDQNIVATVKLYEHYTGKVRIIRAVRGYEQPY
jgi:hypothetical protein